MAPIASGAVFDVYRETVYRGGKRDGGLRRTVRRLQLRVHTLKARFSMVEKIKTEAVKPPVL
jgi:hypothetical protein